MPERILVESDLGVNVALADALKSSDFTAIKSGSYVTTGSVTVTDPASVEGYTYTVKVLRGTAIVGGVTYPVNSTITRSYNAGTWIGSSVIGKSSKRRVIFEGDSLFATPTAYGSTNTIAVLASAMASLQGVQIFNVAQGGNTMGDITSQYATEVAPLKPANDSESVVMFLSIMANNWVFNFQTASELLTEFYAYTAQCKADGIKVYAMLCPRTEGGANAENYQKREDILLGIRKDPSISGYFDITTYLGEPETSDWFDHVHPSATGNPVLAKVVAQIYGGIPVDPGVPETRESITRESGRANGLLGTGIAYAEGATGGTFSPSMLPTFNFGGSWTWTFELSNIASNKTLMWGGTDALGVYITQGLNGSFYTGPFYLVVGPVGGTVQGTFRLPFEVNRPHCVTVSIDPSNGTLTVYCNGKRLGVVASTYSYTGVSSMLCGGGAFAISRPIYLHRPSSLDDHLYMMTFGRPKAIDFHVTQPNLSPGAWTGGGGWALSDNTASGFSVTAATNGTAVSAADFSIVAGDDIYVEFTLTRVSGVLPQFVLVRNDLSGYRSSFVACAEGLNRILLAPLITEIGLTRLYFASVSGGDAFVGVISGIRAIKRKCFLFPEKNPGNGPLWLSAMGDPQNIIVNDGTPADPDFRDRSVKGVSQLVSGVAVVSESISPTDVVQITARGQTLGQLYESYSDRIPHTSFTVKSSDVSDTAHFGYTIFKN